MRCILVFIGILFLLHFSAGVNVQDLAGTWLLSEATGKYAGLPATVPGGVYSDLMDSGVIGDIFSRYNDVDTRWVANSSWMYTANFTVTSKYLSHVSINIVFEGLDTIATIKLNGVKVGEGANMFVRYIFDVKAILQEGSNTLEVAFESSVKVAEELSLNGTYIVPPNCPPSQYNGECHVNQLRKMQASFAWDWGPAFPSVGIWKDVYLEAFDSAVIRYVVAKTTYNGDDDSWSLNIVTYLGTGSNGFEGQLVQTLNTNVDSLKEVTNVNYAGTAGTEISVPVDISVPAIKLTKWWPNGYGDQKLYTLTTEFTSGGTSNTVITRIGFREIELVQEPAAEDPSSGLTFFFRVNGVPIFAKGSNEIPLSVLPEKGQDPALVRRALQSARDANMNMLRVWGGGVYESDVFYDTADELGILIWQDFMFACAMYPTWPYFLENVRAEVRHQMRRLGSHPSIALWAGNNENEAALVGNWYGTSSDFERYKADYVTLYVDTIMNETQKVDGSAIFVSSSPSNGKETIEEGYVSTDPYNSLYGDVHFYNYVANSWNTHTFPVTRFASEYGYQSLPSVDAWMTATSNLTDLSPNSTFMAHRQHLPAGTAFNIFLQDLQFEILNSSSPNYYKAFIYHSQIIQAMSIKIETEHYRSYMNRLNEIYQGRTAGALFWQLNDVWVAPTWSGIDFTGRWKMLQYYARNFFAPTIITGSLDLERQLRVYVVSEVPSLVDISVQVTAVVDVYSWNSTEPLNTMAYQIELPYGTAILATKIDTDPFISEVGCGSLSKSRNNCFFYLTLQTTGILVAPPNHVFVGALKDSALPENPNLKIDSVTSLDSSGKKFQVTLAAEEIALFVWLDSHSVRGLFSDNGFLMVSSTKTVDFEAEEETSVGVLGKVLTVTHFKDAQYA